MPRTKHDAGEGPPERAHRYDHGVLADEDVVVGQLGHEGGQGMPCGRGRSANPGVRGEHPARA